MQETVQGGTFDGHGGLYIYHLDVRAGQRYMVELRADSDGPVFGLRLSTLDALGDMEQQTSFSFEGFLSVNRLVFTAEQDGQQLIGAYGWASHGEPMGFELVAQEIAADDHADLPAQGTPLNTGKSVPGELEWAGDVDCFRMQLNAGQPYRLVLRGDDPAPLLAARLLLSGPDGGGTAQSYFDAANGAAADGCELLFTPAVDGVYTLQIDSAYAAEIGSYRLNLDTRARDDHGDLPSQASGLALGHSEQGRLDGQADSDCFSIVAQAGQRVAVSLRPLDAQSGMSLWLSMHEGRDGMGALASSSGRAAQLIFTAPEDGAYVMRVEGTAGKGDSGDLYRVDAQVLGPDDAPDTSGGVTLLQGQSAFGVLDAAADADRFTAWLQAGQRYRAVLIENGGVSGSSQADRVAFSAVTTEGLDDHNAVTPVLGEMSLVIQPTSDASYDFTVVRWGAVDKPAFNYELQLEPIGLDDHADTADLATALPLDLEVAGQLDTLDDTDYFQFSAVAGKQYWLELRVPARSGVAESTYALLPALSVFMQDGWMDLPSSYPSSHWVDGGAPGDFKGAASDQYMQPQLDGTVIARVSTPPGLAELGYTLHLRSMEIEEPLLGQDRDAGVLQLGGPSELGQMIDGTPGEDILLGTRLDDRLRGGDGDDQLQGGGGNDLLLGGDGIDTAVIPLPRGSMRLEPPSLSLADGWPATDRDSWHLAAVAQADLSKTGMLSLRGVERLQFSDQLLALDLDGHAGIVARLMTLLFPADHGKFDKTLAGIGLAWLDAGRSAESLTLAALASPYFAMLAGSETLVDQWLWICRNADGDPQHQSQMFSHGVDAWMRGQPVAALVMEAAQSLGVTQQLELMGLPRSGLSYEPAPPPMD